MVIAREPGGMEQGCLGGGGRGCGPGVPPPGAPLTPTCIRHRHPSSRGVTSRLRELGAHSKPLRPGPVPRWLLPHALAQKLWAELPGFISQLHPSLYDLRLSTLTSRPQFPHLSNGINNDHFLIGCCKGPTAACPVVSQGMRRTQQRGRQVGWHWSEGVGGVPTSNPNLKLHLGQSPAPA